MKSIKIHKKGWISICLLLMLLINGSFVQAAGDNKNVDKHQIIFALDGSASMPGDKWQEAVDSVSMIEAMLPSNYETAVMVYNEDVVLCTDFGQTWESQLKELQEAGQRGYTNPGLAVGYAMKKFSKDTSYHKRIVFISDGEISMKGQSETEEALMSYKNAVRTAKKENIKIDTLLFQAEGIEEQISYGAETTGGFVYRETKGQPMESFAEHYLFEQLGLERIMLGTSDAAEYAADICLQDVFSENAKILLIAESKMEDIRATCQCKNIRMIQGEKFAVVDLDNPMEENVKVQYTLAEKGKVNAYLIKEYRLSVNMSSAYEEELSKHRINVCITDARGSRLFADKDMCEKIEIYINGDRSHYTVEQGSAMIEYPAENPQEVSVKVNFDNLNSTVFCSEAEGKLWIDLPTGKARSHDGMQYFWLCVIVSGVGVIFAVLLFLLMKAKKKTKGRQKPYKGYKTLARY